jgi:xylulose-5-phosphate/fructose-6-phosphate phosphoketolase
MDADIKKIKKYVRAANYLSVAQIYLQDNFLLERPLTSDDIKPRLAGHWGTCPGINFVYAHLNHLVKEYKQSTILVCGPGHGMSALQANVFMEGTLEKYYKKATRDEKGIAFIGKQYTWPYGFSSHVSPEIPGAILEGGELGYSLGLAYGAVMDNPDLLAACLIGDGEAETGAIAAAWHINKLIDPATNGAVLPILHVNGYRISGPTIFGRMSNKEMEELFSGYGYEPFFVEGEEGDELHKQMFQTLETCYQRIKNIQEKARGKNPPARPRFPMIVMRTPKGMTTIKEIHGQKIEGTILSHQVVMPTVRNDELELKALEDWMKSYKFDELFDKKKGFSKDLLDLVPDEKLLIGNNPHVFGKTYKPLILPDGKKLAKEVRKPGEIQSNAMRMAGSFLKEVFVLNKKTNNIRLMSPDETYSNRLDTVFEETSRGWVWPIEEDDKDITRDGKVMEMLSEHNMQGLSSGYVLTGRHAAFTTYEAFAQIIASMAHMHQKFLKYWLRMPWRGDIPSLNYLLTSTVWRQERDGYSHQNPGFISGMLEKHNDFIKTYFPVDDNSMLAILEEAFGSKNQMNLITANKTPEPRWLTYENAKKMLKQGLSTWDFASDENPHIVLVGVGDYMTRESLAAIELIKRDAPEIRIRFVNILRLQAACSCEDVFHPQIPDAEKYFTIDKPVIVNFHGYPEAMQSILFKVKNPNRFFVHGYNEWGGTTTAYDLLVRNKTDRYHLAMEVAETMKKEGVIAEQKKKTLIASYEKALKDHYDYITTVGAEPAEIENWQWAGTQSKAATAGEIKHIDLLKQARTIAFIGLSDNPERHSNIVAKYFQEKGYRIIPINPKIKSVLGEKSYNSLSDIPKDIRIDIVDIFREKSQVVGHMSEVVERGGVNTVWLAEGVQSHEAEDFAEDYGLTLVTNFCILEAYKQIPN